MGTLAAWSRPPPLGPEPWAAPALKARTHIKVPGVLEHGRTWRYRSVLQGARKSI
jgi:hypothetical protein